MSQAEAKQRPLMVDLRSLPRQIEDRVGEPIRPVLGRALRGPFVEEPVVGLPGDPLVVPPLDEIAEGDDRLLDRTPVEPGLPADGTAGRPVTQAGPVGQPGEHDPGVEDRDAAFGVGDPPPELRRGGQQLEVLDCLVEIHPWSSVPVSSSLGERCRLIFPGLFVSFFPQGQPSFPQGRPSFPWGVTCSGGTVPHCPPIRKR